MADTARSLSNITERYGDRYMHRDPVAASEEVYIGALYSLDAGGDLADATDVAARELMGVAAERVTGGSTDGSAGASTGVFARVYRKCRAIFNSTGTLAVGDLCYVVDNQTVTDAGTAANDIPVGRIYATTGFTARHGMSNAVEVDVGQF
ncbi:MAG TPA: hypothetical protein VFH61_02680 [Thermoleophilia bacterium]|nr:hypothetical protein [Thermoleophilia bacterium]